MKQSPVRWVGKGRRRLDARPRVPGRLLAVFLCGVLMLAGCGARRSEQHRMEGDAYLQLKKFPEAVDAYRKAEVADPNNALAKVGLGRCFLFSGRPEEALVAFRKAIELNPALDPAYTEAVNLLLQNQRADEALQLTERLQAAHPEHGGALRAFILLRTGRAAEAVSGLTELRERFPQSAEVRVNLAGALLAAQQPEKAETEAKAVLDSLDPQSVSARMALVDAYRAQGKVAAMVDEFKKLADINPNDTGLQLGLARCLAYAGRAAEAEPIARHVLEADPQSGWANCVLGGCLIEKRQYSEAMPYLQAAQTALPNQPDVARLIALAESGGKGASSATAPSGPAPSGPAPATPAAPGMTPVPPAAAAPAAPPSSWQDLWKEAALGRLLADRDKYLAQGGANVVETLVLAATFAHNLPLAKELAKGLPAQSPLQAYLAALEQAKLQEILAWADQWKEDDPARQLLKDNAVGFAMGEVGARARAVQVLSKCLQTWPDNAVALYNIAQVFRKAQMPEFAAKTLQKLITQYPDNLDGHLSLFVVLREAGMAPEARGAAEAIFNLFPGQREGVLSLAQAYLDTKETPLAKMVLERGLQTQPDDVNLKTELAGVLVRLGAPDDTDKLLDAVAATKPAAATQNRLEVLKALAASLRGQWDKTAEWAAQVDAGSRGNTLRSILAAASLKTKRPEEAIAALTPPSGDRQVAMGQIPAILLQALGKPQTGMSAADKDLADVLGRDPVALAGLAAAYAYEASHMDDAALDELRKLEPSLGDHARFIQLLFACLIHSERTPKPGDEGHAFALRHEKVPSAWTGLAALQRRLKDVEGERQALAKAIETGPKDVEAWNMQAQFAEKQNDIKGAAEAYRHIVDLRPEDPAANNNLAYCLLTSDGDAQEALAKAQKANEKIPADPNVLHTLGVAQLRTGDLEHSQKSLATALELRPGDPTMLLDFGKLLIAQKQTEEGKRHIQLALRYCDQFGLDFPRRAEAEKLVAAP